MARSAGEALRNHVALELGCSNRLNLNAYVPLLQIGGGAARFFPEVPGNPMPSSALMASMTRRFTESLERFARDRGVNVVRSVTYFDQCRTLTVRHRDLPEMEERPAAIQRGTL